MHASINPSASDTTEADVITGHRVLKYALASLTWGLTVAAAWSCSSVVLGAIVFIIVGIVLALIAQLIHFVCYFKVDASTFASVGSVVNRATSKVTGVFTRKAA